MKGILQVLLCVCCWCGGNAASATTTTKYNEKARYDMTKWGLPAPSEFPGVYKCLTHKNFKEVVLASRDCWVLLFSNGTMDKSWKSLINYWKGAVFFAEIEQRHIFTLLREIGLDDTDQAQLAVASRKTTIGITFPYGGEKMKRKFKICENTGMAIQHVLDGLPANEVYLRSAQEREHFLLDAHTSTVPQIPVMMVADKQPQAKLFLAYCRILASLFQQYFRFAFFTVEDDQSLYAEFFNSGDHEGGVVNVTVPTMSALLASGKDPNIVYRSYPFVRDMMGEASFVNCVYWLYIINDQFRPTIPHHKGASYTEEAAEMKSVAKLLKQRTEVFTQCKNYKDEL